MIQRRDLIAGIFFIVVGMTTIILSLRYSIFSFGNLGPGFLPLAYSMALLGLGLLLAVQGALHHESVEFPALRGPVLIPLAIMVFSLLIDAAGLFIAGTCTIVLAAAAGEQFRWKEVVILVLTILVGAYLLFIQALDLPVRLWPRL